MQKLMKQHQGQAVGIKQKYAEWNAQLQNRLNDLREQRKAWLAEAAVLKDANIELKVIPGFSTVAVSVLTISVRAIWRLRVSFWRRLKKRYSNLKPR